MSVETTNPPVDRTTVLQSKLYQAAKGDPERRFHALYDKLSLGYVLQSAWELVRRNDGAAGIDQQTLADIEAQGVPAFLAGIAQSLQDKTYRPQPVRRPLALVPRCPQTGRLHPDAPARYSDGAGSGGAGGLQAAPGTALRGGL